MASAERHEDAGTCRHQGGALNRLLAARPREGETSVSPPGGAASAGPPDQLICIPISSPFKKCMFWCAYTPPGAGGTSVGVSPLS